MFNFNQEQEFSVDLVSVTHLLDYANQIGVDTSYLVGLDETMTQEQLVSIQAVLQEEIQKILQEQEIEARFACHIGPYANGICTICGGREPKR